MPKALYLLVTPIELLSTFIIRPFSLAVRLFANMLAGHILLVTFSVLCITLWSASILAGVLVLSFPMLVAFTGFEFMVAFLQAFIFSPAHRRVHRRRTAPRPLITHKNVATTPVAPDLTTWSPPRWPLNRRTRIQ